MVGSNTPTGRGACTVTSLIPMEPHSQATHLNVWFRTSLLTALPCLSIDDGVALGTKQHLTGKAAR
eukprot:4830366-Amphidinium_carterae.1